MKRRSLRFPHIFIIIGLILSACPLNPTTHQVQAATHTDSAGQQTMSEDLKQQTEDSPEPPKPSTENDNARANEAMRAALNTFLGYWGPHYKLNLEDISIKDEWAYAYASWQSNDKLLQDSLLILAHKSPSGLWTAQIPGEESAYLQWIDKIPENFLPKSQKANGKDQVNKLEQLKTSSRNALDKRNVRIIPGTVSLSPEMLGEVHAALTKELSTIPDVEGFAVTDDQVVEEAHFISVIGLKGLDDSLTWNLIDNGVWFGLLIMNKDQNGKWDGAIQGTEEFSKKIKVIPDSKLSQRAKKDLDTYHPSGGSVPETYGGGAYVFPWESGKKMYYGTAGVHANGFSSVVGDWKAVDFLSDGNTGAGNAPNRLLASASGSISYKCTPAAGQVTTAIRVGDLMYTHLVNTANIFVGKTYNQKDEIGQMKNGTFSENCGYANQGDSWFHVHWGFPNTGSFQAEGWTLTFSDQLWRSGSQVQGTGSWFTSSGGSPSCPSVSNKVVLYDGTNCTGSSVEANGSGLWFVTPNFNDMAESIAIQSSWSARLYEHDNESSPSICISSTDGDLWDNRFSDNVVVANQATWMRVYDNNNCGGINPPVRPDLQSPNDGSQFMEGESINLSWSATGNDYYGEVWGGPAGTTTFGWQTETNKNIGSQWAGYIYSWHVKARNSAGESSWSNTRTFTVLLGTPTNLRINGNPSCNQVNLSWNDNSGNEEGYRIYRNGTQVGQVGANVTSYTDTGLSENTSYQYVVRAYRGSINSNPSNTLPVTTPQCPVACPDPPVLLSPNEGVQYVEGESITLFWSAIGNEYYGEVWGGPAGTTYFGWQGETSKNIGSQWAGYVYYWHVKARNGSCTNGGNWSSTRTFKVLPGTPANLRLGQDPSCNQVSLAWNDNSGNEEGYLIYRDDNQIGQVGANITSYIDTFASPSPGNHSYVVRAFRGEILSNPSNTLVIPIPPCPVGADLRPYAPPGYEYPVVPSSVPGTTVVNTLFSGQTTYFDWHFINSGDEDAVGDFFVELWIDDNRIIRYPYSGYGVSGTGGFDDWADSVSTPGWHHLKLIVDPENTVAEADEENNVWEGDFNWVSQSVPYNDDMESGENNWTSTGLWHQVDDYTSPYSASHSPSHSWWYGQDATGNYDTGAANSGDLTSPTVFIPSTGYYLRFWYWYQTESISAMWDQRWVQVSVDGGPYENIKQLNNDPMSTWLLSPLIELSAYVGHNIQIRFHFNTIDSDTNSYRGWYIDDFDISTTPLPPCNDSNEPNDSYEQATTIDYGQNLTGNICTEGVEEDNDYFRFTGLAGDRAVVDIDAQINGSALNSYVSLMDSDGSTILIENDDEIYQAFDSKFGYSLPHDGTYYIRVRSIYSIVGNPEQSYNLRLYTDAGNPDPVTITEPDSGSWINPNNQIVTVEANDLESGVQRVEFLWHDANWDNPDWIWLGADTDGRDGWSWSHDTSGLPDQADAAYYVWAFDWIGNWTGAGSYPLNIDRTPPSVSMSITPRYGDAPFRDFMVNWSGVDSTSGVNNYDVQYRDGAGGTWVDLLTATLETAYQFIGENDHTYYFRSRARDVAGNEGVYTEGDGDTQRAVSICAVSPDTYESDDTAALAPWTTTDGNPQTHNIHEEGNADWLKFQAQAGNTYTIATTNIGGYADTVLYLYASDGSTLIDSNDDYPDRGYGSLVSFQPAASGTYYLRIIHGDPWAYGCTTEYSLSVSGGEVEDPQIANVRVSNLRDSSVTISWTTQLSATGQVEYGTTTTLGQTAYDTRGNNTSDDTHYVILTGLTPGTTYYFDVISGSGRDNNNGSHFSVTTGPTLSLPSSDTIYGKVYKTDGNTIAAGSILYLRIKDADGQGTTGQSQLLSAIVDADGYWFLNLGEARDEPLNNYFVYSASGDKDSIEVEGAIDCRASLLVDTSADSPVHDITLSCTKEASLTISAGWNLMSLPLQPVTLYQAQSLLNTINEQGGTCSEIDRWLNGGWNAHIDGLPFNNFDVSLANGYFSKCTGVSSWKLIGYDLTSPIAVTINAGWNLIGVPSPSSGYTAQALLNGINGQGGSCSEIDRWLNGGWNAHINSLPFNNFDIKPDQGYFVKCAKASTFTPTTQTALSAAQEWRKAEAVPSLQPQHNAVLGKIWVANVSDTAFSIVWQTDSPSVGWVEWGNTYELSQTSYDVREQDYVSPVHLATISVDKPETTYYVRVHAAQTISDVIEVKTKATGNLYPPLTVYGQIETKKGIPAPGALVIAQVRLPTGELSDPIASLADDWGYWNFSLAYDTCEGLTLLLKATGIDGATADLEQNACKSQPAPTIQLKLRKK